MPNLFRHLSDYAQSHLTFSGLGKNHKKFSGVFGRDCFVAALLAMTLFSPFFALPSFASADEMTVIVPEYVEIRKDVHHWIPTADLTVTDSETITLNRSLIVQYPVISNSDILIFLNYTVPVSGGNYINAWNQTNDSVVMTKNDNTATEESVINALSQEPSATNNRNVIAFKGYPAGDSTTLVSYSNNTLCVRTNQTRSDTGEGDIFG